MGARDVHGVEPPWGEFRHVGTPHRKIDGLAKATGAAVFTDDIALPGMLHARTLRSPHAHARLVSIDAAAARKLPGVHAVVTGADLPVLYGILPWTQDETALAVERVRYVGEPVAAVAAVDEDTARTALKLVRVAYEPLHAYLDPEESRRRDDPAIHPDRKDGNVSKHVRLAFGDVDAALAAAEVVVEDAYVFHGSTHAAIEPHCAIAHHGADGVLTVWSATQIPHYLHRALARVLGLPLHLVRVIQPCVGGGFGGKSDPFSLEFVVAKLSIMTGRPVKMLYTREEVFYTHRGRHPMTMRYRTGASRDGRLAGVDAEILIDGGAYSSYGLVTTYYAGQLVAAPYELPAYRFDATRVFTNKPPCGPKRGHGSVQPRFAFEVQLDQLAGRLGLDPIELRRRNLLPPGATTVNGLRITSNGFARCLDLVEEASGWRTRRGHLPYGRGLGVAGSAYISGTNYPIYPNPMPQAAVQLKLDRSGLVTVFTGASDIGQGSSTVARALVAEELGLALDQVRVVAADTDLCPVDLGAYSSRETFMVGNALLDACRKLRPLLVEAVSEQWGVEPSRVRFAEGTVADLLDPARTMSAAEAFRLAEARFDALGSTGSYNTPPLGGAYRGGTIGASPAYSFSAHVVEASVDVETGRVTCERVWIAHDCGRALNPMLVAGQMEGSAYMGLAEALFEEHAVDERGLHRGPSLLDYRIPTSVDTPDLKALIVESLDPEGPYGAKEAGEGPLHPSIPALSNAIFDAVGVRLTRLPFTPARVLAALREARPARAATPAREPLGVGGKR
jgi:4-hydroxybenzoyl-CoA reductase subunit alpha